MQLFGVTGGVGMGKSTAGELLRQQGVLVQDTDVIARQLVEPGQPALLEIIKRFGPSICVPLGRLLGFCTAKQLARVVFPDPAARCRS